MGQKLYGGRKGLKKGLKAGFPLRLHIALRWVAWREK